jgi:hypothetical protein
MAMGRPKAKQQGLCVSREEIAKPAAHLFYSRVNVVLDEAWFCSKMEQLCPRFYRPVVGSQSSTDPDRRL